ncbi:MAG: SprB repeat-containing protein, partial [Flavobacteriales bacterium]|nr:SprB repeat-containing protein [Flavobacteriales bacterium]
MKRITLIIFVFLFHNIINGQCLGSQSYTLSPAGPYTAGQNVTVTYTLSNFIQVNVNWIIAFDIDYGNGWSNINPVSAPGNPGGSSGTWIWDTQNTYPSGLNFGPGYRFVNSSWFNPDWGTSSTGPFTLSFNLQVGNSCVNNDLSIDISVIGDCQTGGWNNGSCCPITPYSIYSGTSSGGTGAGNISIVENISDISCNGFSDGLINLNISGGIPPFSTLWSNTSTSQNISNLSAGTYTATITDNQGCTSSESYTLTDPPVFTPIINPSNVSCYGYNDGLIEVINEPASTTYLWSNTTTSSSISNIGSGNYSVDVFNMNGCQYTESFTITEPQQITVISTSNDVSCNGVNDGSIDLTISGGIPDYTINIPPYSQVLQNGGTNYFSPATLSANIYNYSVADANGCVVTDMITINEPSLLSVNPVITNVSCNGESSGAIVLNTTGGTSPYIEDFGGNNPLMLSDGTYSYTLTDANGCTISDNFSITEPDLLLFTSTTTDASCSGYSDGTANIIITGGTTPYNTNWNGQNPNALNAGNFPFTITDDNGCTNQGNITINEPAGMAVIINEVDVNCFGGNDGSAILTISGGAGAPYNIDWGGVDGNNLTAGNFPVTITDTNNCSTTGIATINEPSEIQTTSAINNV